MSCLFFIVTFLFIIQPSLAEEILVVASKELLESSLTKEQVKEAFLGSKIRSDSGVKIEAIDRKQYPGTLRDQFYLALLGMNSTQLKSYWSRQIFTGRGFPPKLMDDFSAIKKELINNVGSITYISSNEYDSKLKPLYRIKLNRPYYQ